MTQPHSVDERFALISRVGEEIVTSDDLRELLTKKERFVAYDGFEPSGSIHIAQGLLRVININKMIKAGATFKMLVADWHGWANNKMGGDLEKIKIVGEYFIEVWKAAGIDSNHVQFIWASDLVKDDAYWKLVMQVARNNTLNRIIRCSQIMGRSESDDLSAAQILYPCMQCADIFYMNIDVCQLGMDQRKVNMLAREIAPTLGFAKPVAVHHHMLMGLSEPPKSDADTVEKAIAKKMSKSNPDSSIFMTDAPEAVVAKLKKAYCPMKQVEDNPVLEYFRYILFELHPSITISRSEKFGGPITFTTYADLEKSFVEGNLHPLDVKNAAAEYINKSLFSVREYFEKNQHAKNLKEKVESFTVTR